MGNKRGQILTWTNLFTLWNNVRKIFGTTTYAHKVWHSEVTEFGSVTHVGEGGVFQPSLATQGTRPQCSLYLLLHPGVTYGYVSVYSQYDVELRRFCDIRTGFWKSDLEKWVRFWPCEWENQSGDIPRTIWKLWWTSKIQGACKKRRGSLQKCLPY